MTAYDPQALSRQIAADLLDIQAVFLRPEEPFTWASGILSPIYCDNRLTYAEPAVRRRIEEGFAALVQAKYPECEALFGTSTSGIGHAAITAFLLDLPAGYVRGKTKDHGRNVQIEGKLRPGEKVVVVEDLISTAGSVLETVEILRQAGADVLGIISIVTYDMQKGLDNLAAARIENTSLTNFDTLADVAAATGYLPPTAKAALLRFRDAPGDPSWRELLV
ncbi:MAG: orotate phosphoribosyltransferase [Oscillospiraceae bacterium]|jgi:orotate phosphoribosyltransferase|nr:orotate phosphoribosyltransferase [Oscillospiraceae bacterium]